MNIMIVMGAIGGLLPDLLRIIASKNTSKMPEYLTWPMFWVGLLLQVALGAFLGYLLHPGDKLSAVAYGFSGPEVITRLVAGITKAETEPNAAPEPGTEVTHALPIVPPGAVQFNQSGNTVSPIHQLLGFWRS